LIAAASLDVTMPIVCGIVLREAAIASAAWRAREHEPEDGSQQAKAKDHANAGAKPNGHHGSSGATGHHAFIEARGEGRQISF
jgi:hypothetical protein